MTNLIFSEAAEQSVIGILLSSPTSIDEILDSIKPNDFFRISHRIIYQLIIEFANKELKIDVITITDKLKDRNLLEEAGGWDYISHLCSSFGLSASNIEHYALIVKQKSILRNLHQAGLDISALPSTHAEKKPEQLIQLAEDRISKINNNESKTEGLKHVNLCATAVFNTMERNSQRDGLLGTSTGFTEIDDATCGLQGGELTLIAARPSMGKTAFAINIAEHICIQGKKTVLFFSLEMKEELIGFRLLSSLTNIDQSRLKAGRLQDDDWTRLTHATKQLSESQLYFDDCSDLTVLDIKSRAKKIANKTKIDVIIIDYLQLITPVTKAENKNLEIAEISKALKSLAKSLNVSVVALSQLNRSTEGRPNKKPILSDLRDSGSLEQDADVIMMIYRDDYYNPDSQDKGFAEIIIGKNRNGETRNVKLRFIKEKTRFYNPNLSTAYQNEWKPKSYEYKRSGSAH